MAATAPDPATIEDNPLVAALRAIPASGTGSFENLVRDLLSRETGQRFTLAKSGPQGRVAARTAGDGFANDMGVETNVKSDDLRLMPFDLLDNAVTGPLRREAMRDLALHQLLFEAASGLRRQVDTADLLAIIGEMLDGSTYDYARALVLAGELDHDDAADALWNERLLGEILTRWLAEVRSVAHRRYLRTITARHWFTAFVDAAEPIFGFATFGLFLRCASHGCARWATRTMDSARIRITARAYDNRRINVPAINALLKEDGKSGKEALAYTRVPRHDQAPWH